MNTNYTFGNWNNITDLQITINNLHPFYNYTVFVAGSTIIGTGPFATSEIQTHQAGKDVKKYCYGKFII